MDKYSKGLMARLNAELGVETVTQSDYAGADEFELDVKISLPDTDYKKIVVMCHGLTSSKEGRREQLKIIAEKFNYLFNFFLIL